MNKNRMIFELLNQDDNGENLLSWADCFLSSLSAKKVNEIYNREVTK